MTEEGTRGLIEVTTLKALPEIKYDLISGTSTGAIETCLLALNYSIDEITEFYTGDCVKKIFKPYSIPISFNPFNCFMHTSTYNPKNLQSVLRDKMKDVKLGDIEQKILIPAYDIKARKVKIFTNLVADYDNLYLRDIAQSSASAPLFFTPHIFSEYCCVDGGLFANNPALCAYGAVKHIDDKPLVVSLGTGSFSHEINFNEMCVNNPISFVTNLIDCFMDGSSDVIELGAKTVLGENYVRFQLKLPKELSAIDNVTGKNIKGLIELTESYIKEEWSSELARLIELVKE